MSMLLRRITAAPSGRYFTPRNASGMSATIMSALKITALRIALCGECRNMMLSLSIGPCPIDKLNIMFLHSPQSAILSAVIFNALIIVALIPLALRGVKYRPLGAAVILRNNMLIYGIGGILVPFIFIKLIDLLLVAVHLAP